MKSTPDAVYAQTVSDLENLITIEELLPELGFELGASSSGSWVAVKCLYHDDSTASAAVNKSNGFLVCKACGVKKKWNEVCLTLDIDSAKRWPVKPYFYENISGKRVYAVVRFFPKTFKQWSIEDSGNLVRGNPPQVPLFNWKAVTRSPGPIFLVEGEKDAETLIGAGVVATTNIGGATNWKPELGKYFGSKAVIAIPDNDEAGRVWASAVKNSVENVKLLALPPSAKDTTDFFERGGNLDGLRRLPAYDSSSPRITPRGEPRGKVPSLHSGNALLQQQTANLEPVYVGIPFFDKPKLLRKHGVFAIGGRPGQGKTTAMAQLVGALSHQYKLLVLPFEEEAEIFLKRILVQRGVIPNLDSPVPLGSDFAGFENLLFFERPPKNIFQLRPLLEARLANSGVDFLVVDHLQQLWAGGAGNGHFGMNTICQVLTDLRDKFKLTLLLCAQLHRPPQGADEYERPGMEAFRESGSIEETCSTIVMLNKEGENKVGFNVVKNRYGVPGRFKAVTLNPNTLLFEFEN